MTEKFIVVDTETTNSLDDPFCYDCGWAVVDSNGKVYEEHSYVVADIFLDKEMMNSAYYAEKVPQYWKDIKAGKRELKTFFNITKIFRKCVKEYKIKKIFAHNARFDYRSLTLTQRYITSSKYRYFFPLGIEIWDTLKMAREVLKDNDSYSEFCYSNEYLTKRMCKRYTAEIIYRFLIGDTNFEESHTGLEDVKIEKEILAYCFKIKPEIDGRLWKD